MNYKSSYTHYTVSDLGENTNDIIMQKALLPSQSQRLSEAAVIDLETMEILLLEKKYDVNGDKGQLYVGTVSAVPCAAVAESPPESCGKGGRAGE